MDGVGDHVLVRATVSADGRTVTVAPGVELVASAVAIVADLPPSCIGLDVGIVIMFETSDDLREFVRAYQSEEII